MPRCTRLLAVPPFMYSYRRQGDKAPGGGGGTRLLAVPSFMYSYRIGEGGEGQRDRAWKGGGHGKGGACRVVSIYEHPGGGV